MCYFYAQMSQKSLPVEWNALKKGLKLRVVSNNHNPIYRFHLKITIKVLSITLILPKVTNIMLVIINQLTVMDLKPIVMMNLESALRDQ